MKFYDAVGYSESVETFEGSGVYEDIVTERKLMGDVLRNTRALEEGDKVNNDLTIGNRFSLVADPFSRENFDTIKYIKWKGRRYLIRQVEYVPPRLLITPGGVYSGPTPTAPDTP